MAKLDYKKMSEDILANVGGSENLANVNHCATRLRLKLKDPEKAKAERPIRLAVIQKT